MTKPGETDDYALSDHIKAVIEHANNKVIDYCVYDRGEIVPEFVRIYNKDGAFPVEQDIEKCKEQGVKLISKEFACIENNKIRHNPVVVADSIIEIICEDLQFKDMQDDPKYVRMNSKLKASNEVRKEKEKEKNKKQKSEKKAVKKVEKANPRLKSKFSTKYNDRIRSIKNSDAKREEKRKWMEDKK